MPSNDEEERKKWKKEKKEKEKGGGRGAMARAEKERRITDWQEFWSFFPFLFPFDKRRGPDLTHPGRVCHWPETERETRRGGREGLKCSVPLRVSFDTLLLPY